MLSFTEKRAVSD